MRAPTVEAFVKRLTSFAHAEFGQLRPRRFAFFCANLLPSFALGYSRTTLLRLGGIRIAPQSRVNGRFELTGPGDCSSSLVSIGRNTLVSGPLHVDLGAPIGIGDNVRIGHRVSLLTLTHEVGGPDLRGGKTKTAPIVIEDGVWIGSEVAILPGVRIGRGSIVATGAVVHRDVPPNVMVGGVPARVIRQLPATPHRDLPEGYEASPDTRRSPSTRQASERRAIYLKVVPDSAKAAI